MFEHVLIGVSDDAPSMNALTGAVRLARRVGAKIEVLHVEEDHRAPTPLIARVHETLRETGFSDTPLTLRQGIPSRILVARGQEFRADLIVIGPHRKRLLDLGSTARELLNETRVPVLIHPSVGEAPPRKVVLGTDLGEGARRSFDFARDLASAFDLPVEVVHCFVGHAFAYRADAGPAPTYAVDAEREQAELRFAEFFDAHDWHGVRASRTLVQDDPVHAFSSRGDADWIVVGRHGDQGAFASLFATNARLRALLPSPLFVVPHE